MDIEEKITQLITEKNKANARLESLEAILSAEGTGTLRVKNLQIGNITVVGDGEHQGFWHKENDGLWKKLELK